MGSGDWCEVCLGYVALEKVRQTKTKHGVGMKCKVEWHGINGLQTEVYGKCWE